MTPVLVGMDAVVAPAIAVAPAMGRAPWRRDVRCALRKIVVIGLLLGAVSIGGATATAGSRRVSDAQTYTYTRAWAGFVARSPDTAFSDVRASWRVPRVVCNRPSSAVAFWVGLGGARVGSAALEQIGTAVDCSDRAVASYSAWYQTYPSTAADVPVVLRPGDTVAAEVRAAGDRVDVSFVNDSTGGSFARQLMATTIETDSAEWIAEAPSSCVAPTCAPLPLAAFGRVTFSSATATAGGSPSTLADPQLRTELFAIGRPGRVAARPLRPRLAAGSVLG